MLRLDHVTKHFGGVKAVDDVSLCFKEREISAIIGPNGAGKTTIFNLINGFLRPDSGEILLKTKPITGLPPRRIASCGMGRMFQDNRNFGTLTCLENILLAKKGNPGENPLNSFFAPGKVRRFENSNLKDARKWLDFVDLPNMENVPAGNLSYGQQKLLAFARLMAAEPEFLLLDEPSAGVNPTMIGHILNLIKRIVNDEGKTVVLIEHDMSVILKVTDLVYFMDDGRVRTFGTPEDVLADKRVHEAYLGI